MQPGWYDDETWFGDGLVVDDAHTSWPAWRPVKPCPSGIYAQLEDADTLPPKPGDQPE